MPPNASADGRLSDGPPAGPNAANPKGRHDCKCKPPPPIRGAAAAPRSPDGASHRVPRPENRPPHPRATHRPRGIGGGCGKCPPHPRTAHPMSLLLYTIAALAEIAGCFAVWIWQRGASPLWLIPAALSLAAFAYPPGPHPAQPRRPQLRGLRRHLYRGLAPLALAGRRHPPHHHRPFRRGPRPDRCRHHPARPPRLIHRAASGGSIFAQMKSKAAAADLLPNSSGTNTPQGVWGV